MAKELETITKQQLAAIFRDLAQDLLHELDAISALKAQDPEFDVDFERTFEEAYAWSERLRAAQGTHARLDQATETLMHRAGQGSELHFHIVEKLLSDRDYDAELSLAECETYLKAVGAAVTPKNIALTRQTQHRAAAVAYAAVDRRWSGDFIEDEALLTRTIAAPQPDFDVPAAPDSARRSSLPVSTQQPRPPVSQIEASSQQAPRIGIDDRITVWTNGLIKNKTKRENGKEPEWSDKTARQVRQLGDLFERFTREEFGFEGLASLHQWQLAKFEDFLRHEIYKHTGKRPADHTATIAQLRDYARSKSPEDRGLQTATLNRHWGFLKQIIDHAEGRGLVRVEKLSTKKLRAKNQRSRQRARDERPGYKPEELIAIFKQPAFMGCAGWENKDFVEHGNFVFHRALYFVPILCAYTGARRDEVAGLMVDEIVTDHAHPYLHFEFNKNRTLKNPQSRRDIPLHPEVLRLNFLDYVHKIKSLGYDLLFPDLKSNSRSPLGDLAGDQLTRVLKAAGIKASGKLLHSMRHGFGDSLKKQKVTEEERGDLAGHRGKTETSERYCEAYPIEQKFEIIMKLPNVTSHLKPHDIRLLPWVREKRNNPHARASRFKGHSLAPANEF